MEQWGEKEDWDSDQKRCKCEGQVSEGPWGVGAVLPSGPGLLPSGTCRGPDSVSGGSQDDGFHGLLLGRRGRH